METDAGTRRIERATGALRFEDVGFRYPGSDTPALVDIDLDIRPGEVIALVGTSGAGKTTLVNLLPRFIEPTEGRILLDGIPLDELRLTDLRAQIGLVSQDIVLFNDSVRANVCFGSVKVPDDEAVWAALRAAALEEYVRALPGGLDYEIGERGTRLSGGQRQRLAIARALVVRPEIYVFDDSFSALDLATDARLRAALAPHTADAAVLIVAQRVSTIRNADRILVLEDGAVVGLGTHDELVETCPTYAEIVASQHAQGAVA